MTRLLDKDDLHQRGIRDGDSTLRRRERLGLFPRRVKRSRNQVGWVEEEVDAYIAGLVGQRDAAQA